MNTESCYICGRPLNNANPVYLEDDSHFAVHVGLDCYSRVVKAGYDGVRSGKGRGPRVFVTRHMAEAYALRTASERLS